MKSHILTITEPDDITLAIKELESQLSKIELRKNTIGIVSVHPEFIHSGVYAAAAKGLPFNLVGGTTLSQSVNGTIGTHMFSIVVLTSDDCEFACSVSDPMTYEDISVIRGCYERTRAQLQGDVKLALLYTPFIETGYVATHMQAISKNDGIVPIFGAVPSADLPSIVKDRRTVYSGCDYNDRLVLLLVSGNFSPAFYAVSATSDSVQDASAKVEPLSIISKEAVMETLRDILAQIKEDHTHKLVLMYSCLGRKISLLDESTAECDLIRVSLAGCGMSYAVSYACDVICLTSIPKVSGVSEAQASNNAHNCALVACVM